MKFNIKKSAEISAEKVTSVWPLAAEEVSNLYSFQSSSFSQFQPLETSFQSLESDISLKTFN